MGKAKRVNWIDAARGLGIIAIVLGHAYLPVAAQSLPASYWMLFTCVYAFHVPLFMALSGLVFNAQRVGCVSLLKTRALRIGLPYLFWAALSVTIFLALGSVAGQALDRQVTGDPLLLARQVMYANPSDNGMRWNTPLWFLTALVIAQAVHWCLAWIVTALRLPAWVTLILSVGLAAMSYFTIWTSTLPWSVERAMVLLPFFSAGAWVGPRARTWRPSSKLRWGAAGVLALVAMVVVAMGNGLVDYVAKDLHNPVLWVITAALGIVGVVGASIAMSSWGWLTWAGQASMTILVVHKFPLIALQLVAGKLPVDYSTAMAPVTVLVMTALTLVLSASAHPVIMRMAPWAVGGTFARAEGPKPRRAQ